MIPRARSTGPEFFFVKKSHCLIAIGLHFGFGEKKNPLQSAHFTVNRNLANGVINNITNHFLAYISEGKLCGQKTRQKCES